MVLLSVKSLSMKSCHGWPPTTGDAGRPAAAPLRCVPCHPDFLSLSLSLALTLPLRPLLCSWLPTLIGDAQRRAMAPLRSVPCHPASLSFSLSRSLSLSVRHTRSLSLAGSLFLCVNTYRPWQVHPPHPSVSRRRAAESPPEPPLG